MLILNILNDLFTVVFLRLWIDFGVDLQVKRGGGYAALLRVGYLFEFVIYFLSVLSATAPWRVRGFRILFPPLSDVWVLVF